MGYQPQNCPSLINPANNSKTIGTAKTADSKSEMPAYRCKYAKQITQQTKYAMTTEGNV
jgi:hypothetical protein